MGSVLGTCTERDKTRSCCDVNSSLFGEDAFYRDNFYDCSEGDASQDYLFLPKIKEQARLKFRKLQRLTR